MSKTRRDFILEALEEIGIASYVFDVDAGMLKSASRRLDNILADWNGQGLHLGMMLSAFPDCEEYDAPMGIPDFANRAIVLRLAVELAPSYGKQISQDTRTQAETAFRTILARCVVPVEYPQGRNMPLGQGNKPWRYNRIMVFQDRHFDINED